MHFAAYYSGEAPDTAIVVSSLPTPNAEVATNAPTAQHDDTEHNNFIINKLHNKKHRFSKCISDTVSENKKQNLRKLYFDHN